MPGRWDSSSERCSPSDGALVAPCSISKKVYDKRYPGGAVLPESPGRQRCPFGNRMMLLCEVVYASTSLFLAHVGVLARAGRVRQHNEFAPAFSHADHCRSAHAHEYACCEPYR